MADENKTIAEVKQRLLNGIASGNDTAARDYKLLCEAELVEASTARARSTLRPYVLKREGAREFLEATRDI